MRRLLPCLLLAVPLLLLAQDPPPQKKGGGGGGAPKNLKILKPEEIGATMAGFRAGLGVQCTFCHNMADRSSDEIPMKVTARMMLGMVREINAKFPDGKEHVTCYTCHRGAQMPLTAPAQ